MADVYGDDVKFSVTAADGTTATYDGTFNITDAGVLSVKPEKDSGANPVIFSPRGWFTLEIEDAPASVYENRGLLTF